LAANQLPVSSQILAQLRGGLEMSASAFQAKPADLAALMAVPRHLALAYPFLYGDTSTSAYDASWTPVTAASAVDELIKAWGGDEDGSLRPVVTFVLKSMFKESAFRAGDVSV